MLHLNNLKSKANFLNLQITSTQHTRICCSSAIFNMCYATPSQPKSLPTKLSNATLIQPDFFKLSENDFRGLHLHNLESQPRYHFTLHSHNLILLPQYNLIPGFYNCTTSNHCQRYNFIHYTSTTQLSLHLYNLISGSTLAQPEIFILMVKW